MKVDDDYKRETFLSFFLPLLLSFIFSSVFLSLLYRHPSFNWLNRVILFSILFSSPSHLPHVCLSSSLSFPTTRFSDEIFFSKIYFSSPCSSFSESSDCCFLQKLFGQLIVVKKHRKKKKKSSEVNARLLWVSCQGVSGVPYSLTNSLSEKDGLEQENISFSAFSIF